MSLRNLMSVCWLRLIQKYSTKWKRETNLQNEQQSNFKIKVPWDSVNATGASECGGWSNCGDGDGDVLPVDGNPGKSVGSWVRVFFTRARFGAKKPGRSCLGQSPGRSGGGGVMIPGRSSLGQELE